MREVVATVVVAGLVEVRGLATVAKQGAAAMEWEGVAKAAQRARRVEASAVEWMGRVVAAVAT